MEEVSIHILARPKKVFQTATFRNFVSYFKLVLTNTEVIVSMATSDFAFLFRHIYLGGEDLRKGPGIMEGKKER